ncbi:MAG: flagellar basal body L-ring protein FlgH [Hyphomonadaceae bacterium]|nr:MAG: flgH [Caulobacteraceae bacterium]MBT9445329.1 flagellar basal body L-ring protein FlgH [Hyphomonadaceae bacterium]TPW04677.1 MAG: flgH [Alphaproteobacteria bacterium]
MSSLSRAVAVLVLAALVALHPAFSNACRAEDLFGDGRLANLAADPRANRVGDVLVVIVAQTAEARNGADSATARRTGLDGSLRAGGRTESGSISVGGAFGGRGEVRRSASFDTEVSVAVEEILPNGDFRVAGVQRMNINGERTLIRIRGRVRPADIEAGNRIVSTRIADAEIDYSGDGPVLRAARPGVLQRVASLLGLGG